MPALINPRHEAFAQAIFAGLAGKTRIDRAQSTAYRKAYPNCSNGNSAEAAASRLLRNAKPILDRVRELQAEANARQQSKIDLSRERVGRRLDKASRIAEEQGNASAMAASELGIAKVFHSASEPEQTPFDFKSATSMHDDGGNGKPGRRFDCTCCRGQRYLYRTTRRDRGAGAAHHRICLNPVIARTT